MLIAVAPQYHARMVAQPAIFISATSADLHSARDLVAKMLVTLGFAPVWQDIAATQGGDLRQILRERIAPCAAVIQLVGHRYGAEPPEPDPQFGRVSFTQFEALHAERAGKRVIYIVVPESFPTDACEPESPELARLQAEYRKRLESSEALRQYAGTPLELENRVLRLRDDLATLRAQMIRDRRRVMIAIAALFALALAIGAGVWGLNRAAKRQESTVTRIESNIAEQKTILEQVTPAALAGALASANAAKLMQWRGGSVTTGQIAVALTSMMEGSKRTVASAFFENSRGAPEAIAWLTLALKDGLDPNLLLPADYYDQEAILIVATRAGNADAAIALLGAGASPHGYQNIWFTAPELPRFLFPYAALMKADQFTADEKRRLAEAYRDAGAVLTRDMPGVPLDSSPNSMRRTTQTLSVDEALSGARLGVVLGETPQMCYQSVNPIADAASRRTGTDWAAFIRDMPKRIDWDPQTGSPYVGLVRYEVRNLIAVVKDRAYFLGVAQSLSPQYILVEVSRDAAQWHIYCHMQPEAGMGFCKKDDDGYQPDGCWRRINMTFDRGTMTMLVEDYYKYTVSINCN